MTVGIGGIGGVSALKSTRELSIPSGIVEVIVDLKLIRSQIDDRSD